MASTTKMKIKRRQKLSSINAEAEMLIIEDNEM